MAFMESFGAPIDGTSLATPHAILSKLGFYRHSEQGDGEMTTHTYLPAGSCVTALQDTLAFSNPSLWACPLQALM